MKDMFKVTAISLFLAAPAFAGQDGSALNGLLAASAGFSAPLAPAALPANEAADRALASDVLDLGASNADFLAAYAQGLGYKVFELDGSRMTTKPALLDYTTQMLRFPGIPENWDAMIDFIGDLSAIHRNNHILIVVRNSSKISLKDRQLYADLREVAEFACRNAREWSKGDITIKFAFVP